jgi:hypothetical protein
VTLLLELLLAACQRAAAARFAGPGNRPARRIRPLTTDREEL